ncbi:EF0163 family protein [Enterococcus sp. DIV1368c]|uniref:EF0163 family protein n=1 Tax=Enterococcus sp. DIV1368c TaxID=2774815 RepID=UPI003F22A8B7
MRRKVMLSMITLLSVFLSACRETQQETTSTVEESKPMQIVETGNTKKQEAIPEETTATTESKEETQETEPSDSDKKNIVVDNLELLTAYGEAYANFSSIDHRNRKLKELMTEECIQLNGIDVETGIMLESSGKIVSIFQNEEDEAAVLLECQQNGSTVHVLLVAKVEDGKIAEMTYNTLKREY